MPGLCPTGLGLGARVGLCQARGGGGGAGRPRPCWMGQKCLGKNMQMSEGNGAILGLEGFGSQTPPPVQPFQTKPGVAGGGGATDGLWTEARGQQTQSNGPHNNQHIPPIRQPLGAADAQTAHPATSSTAPAHQPLGSANAETTPAGAPAAAADRKQRPDATCEGKNG